VSYHKELVELADSLGLSNVTTKTIVTALNVPPGTKVLFLLSVPNTLKKMLLDSARLLVYTPANEHFGIVPLEAMLAGVPVLACNTGGPMETVVEGVTGWLRSPGAICKWTEIMDTVLNGMSEFELKAMAEAGPRRVKSHFAETQMAERLDLILEEIGDKRCAKTTSFLVVALWGLLRVAVFVALGAFAWSWMQDKKG